jgi:hypothetical protein
VCVAILVLTGCIHIVLSLSIRLYLLHDTIQSTNFTQSGHIKIFYTFEL